LVNGGDTGGASLELLGECRRVVGEVRHIDGSEGGLGAVGVVLGVLFGQSRQEYAKMRNRATALARDVSVIGEKPGGS
jgi:hypothetical protein